MDSYSVQAVLSVKDKNFTSTMKSAQSTLSGLDSSTSKASSGVGALGTAFAVAQTVVSAACNVIKNSVQDAVSRVDTLNQYPKIMEQMGFSSEQAEASVQKLSDRIQGLPTSLDSIVASTQNIAILTGDLDLATNTALALNDAFLASGSSTAEAERGLTQYVQMLSSGKVDMQSWKTLQETMGYALSETAKQLGITSGNTQELYSALQSGQITFDEFNAAIIECDTCTGGFAETASIACEGIATSWENVKTAVVRGVANMIQAWNEAAADNGLPTIQENLQKLQSVCDTVFNAASKAITVFVSNLDTIVGAVTPVVAAVAGLKVVQTVSKYFTQFKSSAQASCDVLQNYSKRAEEAKKATENVKTAEQALKNAMEQSKSAVNNVAAAQEKLNAAYDKRDAAAQKVAEAEEKVAASTEEDTTASEELKAAEEELAAAEDEVEAATQKVDAAMQQKQATTEQTAQAEQQLADAQEAESAAIEGTTLKAIAHSAAMNVMTGQMGLAEAAMKAFNAACDANPVGLVITAVTTAVSIFTTLMSVLRKFKGVEESVSDSWDEMKDSVEDFNDSIKETDASIQKNMDAAHKDASAIQALSRQILSLADSDTRTAEQTERLNSYIDELNGLVPNLGAAFDETTNSLNMSAEAFEAFTEASAQMDLLTASTDACAEKEQELADITEQLGVMEDTAQASIDQITNAKGLLEKASLNDVIACKQEIQEVENLKEAQAQATEELNALQAQRQAQIEVTKQAVLDAYDQECAALDEMVANDTISYEQLSEANQQTVDDMKGAIDDLASSIEDGSQRISTSLDMTAQEYLDNLAANQQAIEEWGNNMETLRNRFEELGLDQAILDQWAEVPDQGIPLAAMFVDESDEKLQELAASAPEAVETAATSSVQAWGVAADEIPSAIQEYVTDPTNDSISEQLRDIDWSEPTESLMENLFNDLQGACGDLSFDELGISMDEGIGEGLTSSTAGSEAATQDAQDIRDAAGAAAGEGSPASEWVPLGQSMDEGVAEGLNTSTAGIEAAQQLAQRITEAMATALSEADYSSTFDGLTQAVTSGMAQMESAVTSGMATVSAAMQTGFTGMGSVASSQMSIIVQAVSSGMSSVTSTMTSGVNNVKQVLTQGFTQMATTTTTQMNKIKTTVTTNMNNIKSTITSSLNSIKSTWSSAMSSIASSTSSGMSRVKSVWQSGMNSIKSMAQSTKSSVISTFNSMYSGMYSAGANAMGGLQAGLNSRRGSVIATAQSIASAVTSTINSALKVGSPSKVLKETGKWAGQGLVNGLKAMLGDVQKISEQMADMVTSIAIGEFDSPKLAFAGMDMSVSYDYSTDDILTALGDIRDAVDEDKVFEFTIPFEIDGKEVAKATATYTQEQLDKLQARQSRRDKFSISGG